MNSLALKMLFGDRAKYLMLVSGIVFAALLMSQGLGLFCGMMTWTYATITNVRAPLWVGDPAVHQVGDNLKDVSPVGADDATLTGAPAVSSPPDKRRSPCRDHHRTRRSTAQGVFTATPGAFLPRRPAPARDVGSGVTR